MELKKFVARFDKVGKFENAKIVKEREVIYWAYDREGARDYFDKEHIRYSIIYPK